MPKSFRIFQLRNHPLFISSFSKLESTRRLLFGRLQHTSIPTKMPTDQNGLLTDKTLSSIPFLTPVLMPSKFLHWKNDENWKYWDELETVKEPLKTTNKTEVLEFSVVQWNVWFDNMWLRERSEGLHLTQIFNPNIYN